MITGKLVSDIILRQDFSDFERFTTEDCDMYQSGLHSQTLLVKRQKEEVDDTILNQYFDDGLMKEKFSKQRVYVKSPNDEKDYHIFKLINIKNANEVEEVFTFKHPKYAEN